ncbi:hypothetical protein FGF1_06890 [Flavobacteriaceae bacterium GF1]
MESEKDIGKLIAEQLSDSEVEQSNSLVWKAIEKTLRRRRFLRLGLIWVSTIVVLTSLSYLLVLPAIQEKRNEKQTIPKVAKDSKNDSSDRNNVKSNVKKENGNQTSTNSGLFKDSIDIQILGEKGASYRKLTLTQTKNATENLKTKNGKENFIEGTSQEASTSSIGKSNNGEKLHGLYPNQEKNSPIGTKANHRDINDKSNKTTTIVNQSNPEIAKKLRRFTDEIAIEQNADKIDKFQNPITESDSLRSKHIDSLRSKKSSKITKIDRKLKKNAVDSTNHKKKSNLEYYFLPLVNTSLYSRLKDESTIDRALDGNKKTSNLRFGFGGYGSVRVNPKFEIRLGILYSNYSKKTFDVSIIPNDSNTNYYTNVDFKNGLNYDSFSNSFSQPEQLTLQEELAYLEFPVDFVYRVWKKSKWTADVMAGAGTSILLKNRLNALTESGDLLFLGENKNYAKYILSIRLGTGINYNFNDYLSLRLELISKPTFGTFNTSQVDNPILLNANFGIAIKL